MAKQKVVAEGTFLQLDPALILSDDNTRFGLKQSRIESLAADILAKGGVMENVEVEPLATPVNGHQYRLTTGGYRHAAVLHLNNTLGAGLTLPAIIHTPTDAVDRLKRQVGENYERENMSPMDTALAIKKMLDEGASKIDVRSTFARPGTTKKGGKAVPASNSWVNIHLAFLGFPKRIQDLIHTGELGVNAAYQLTRMPPDKWESVLEKAQADRQRAIETEEREEEKFLASEKKAQEAQTKAQESQAELDKVLAVVKTDTEALEAATHKAEEAYAASKGKFTDAKDKKAKQDAFKDAEKERAGLQAKLDASTKDMTKVKEAHAKVAQVAAERAAKLKEMRTTSPAGAAKQGKAVGRKDVAQAAQETGASTGTVPLNASEMRKTVNELMLPGTAPKVLQIATAFHNCFSGITTPHDLYKDLCKVTGEKPGTHSTK